MNIVDVLIEVANKNKDVTAFVEEKNNKVNKISYLELTKRATGVAKYFKSQGINSGDYVTVLITMSIDLYVALIALWYIGAIPVFFDVSASKEYVNKCSEIIKPKAIVGTKLTLLFSYMMNAFNKCRRICIPNEFDKNSNDFLNEKNLESQGALVTFTSGSTGIPKTIVRTHEFLLNQYEIIKNTMKYEDGQIDLGILPVFTLANLASGITTVIPNSKLNNMQKINVKNIVKQIEEHKISTMTISPAVLKQIADYAKINNIELSSIKRVFVGGGPVFPNMLSSLDGKDIKKTIVYGSSEAEPISEFLWEDMLKVIERMMSGEGLPVGKVVDGVELKIIDRNLGDITDGDSLDKYLVNTGEIIVSGDNVLKGYYGGYGDKENKIKIKDKTWHRTGDCGYLDKDNILWLVGGKKTIISKDGRDIYPFVIQCVLNMKFNISKSAVLSCDGKVLLIVEKTDFSSDIFAFVKNFGVDDIEYVEKIPMDKRHGAKVDYNRLIKSYKRRIG